jgi:hypothetical protein
MGFYDIDYDELVLQLLPTWLRQPMMKAWLRVLVNPVKSLYNLFKANRKNDLYILSHSGQVCYLEAALNDALDPFLRGIYITDGPFEDPLFLYLDTETKPLWLGLVSEEGLTPYPDPEPLYTDAETYGVGVCFIVHVPIPVSVGTGYDINRLKAIVDLYRLPGRSFYSVVTY